MDVFRLELGWSGKTVSRMTTEDETLEKLIVPAVDRILGQKFPVLDDGFIRLVDYMGADSSIVQAARVSYGSGTKKVHQDEGLIRYLMRHSHTTPFEMCELKLHVRVPMDCWRQWIRHRTASVNEYSTRYSIAIDSAQRTQPDQWREQSGSNRQGSEEGRLNMVTGLDVSREEQELLDRARGVYENRVRQGVAREQARKDLPLSTYTEAYWKVDLHNLFHFLDLRMDPHAQAEIREYAEKIGAEIVSKWCPIAWRAFLDYRVGALTLSSRENSVIRFVNSGDVSGAIATAKAFGWIGARGAPLANRERIEAEAKLTTLGISIPWTRKKES